MMKNNIKNAFTLAETLVVIGIIGVVAALTIPNLNASTSDKEKVTRVKKAYSELQEAYGRAEATYGPARKWFAEDANTTAQTNRFATRMLESMKTQQASSNNSTFSNVPDEISWNRGYYARLTDGAVLAFDSNATNSTVYIDVDGFEKGENKIGLDIFVFTLNYRDKNGFLPVGYSTSALGCCTAQGGNGCTYWVIKNGNMDYKKADNNHKCPNKNATGNTITLDYINNTSCK